jgi:hypothetical protein
LHDRLADDDRDALIIAVPVTDAPVIITVIACPPESRSRALADLIRTATRL